MKEKPSKGGLHDDLERAAKLCQTLLCRKGLGNPRWIYYTQGITPADLDALGIKVCLKPSKEGEPPSGAEWALFHPVLSDEPRWRDREGISVTDWVEGLEGEARDRYYSAPRRGVSQWARNLGLDPSYLFRCMAAHKLPLQVIPLVLEGLAVYWEDTLLVLAYKNLGEPVGVQRVKVKPKAK